MKGRSFPLEAVVGYECEDDVEQRMVMLRYEPSMPWSVKIIVPGLDIITSRDLLSEGLMALSGDSDVMVGPDEDDPDLINMFLRIADTTTNVHMTVEVRRRPFAKALYDMNRMIPRGHEQKYMDWDTGMGICEDA